MEGEALLKTRFPWDLFFALARDLPRGNRSLIDDCADMVSRMQPPPIVAGTEHIHPQGPLVIAANHYQRRGLWIGWAAAVITLSVAERRDQPVPVHWLVTGGLRLLQSRGRGPEIPLSDAIFRAVARTYRMTALPLTGPKRRAASISSWLRQLESGEVLGLFPEGLVGRSDALRRPDPGFERLSRILASRNVAVLPVAVFEEGGCLHVRFGPSFPASSSIETMQAIARLLPPSLRGPYGDVVHGTVE